MSKISIQWSEKEPMIEVTNADELDHVLNEMKANVGSEYPMIVFVNTHGYRVSLGLGHMGGFLHFEQETGDPPYIITVGDRGAEGVAAFYLFGIHHTEIPRHSLIPAVKAREVLYEWIQTAVRLTNMDWEEV